MFRIIYWFNPAVILVLKKIPLERELACDASVLAHLSAEDYPLYGASLLNLAEKLSSYPSASGMVSKGSQLRRRILGITSFRHRNRKQKWKSVISYLLISVLIAGMIPVLSAYAGSEETVSLHGKTTENLEISTDFHGFDGSFVLYEDDGDGYAYEQGKYNQISLTWKDDEHCLTIGAAEHTFAQGLKGRECRVILEGDKVEKRFVYDGKERRISL